MASRDTGGARPNKNAIMKRLLSLGCLRGDTPEAPLKQGNTASSPSAARSQVVDLVAKSHNGAGRAPEPGQNPRDPAAGKMPFSGQVPGDPTAGGTSALGRVHEAGQEMGNAAAGSCIPPEQAPEVSLATSSSGGVAQTTSEQACRAASSNAVALEAFQAMQPRLGAAPTSDVGAVETREAVQPLETSATRSNAAAARRRQVVQPPLNLYSNAAAVGERQAVQPPQALAPSSNPTAVGNLADGQQPARLAAKQAAQAGLVRAMPSTWPMFGIVTERQADAQTASSSAPAAAGQPGPATPSQTLLGMSVAPGAIWRHTAGRPSDTRPATGARDMSPLQSSSELRLRTGAERVCQRQPAQQTVRSNADKVFTWLTVSSVLICLMCGTPWSWHSDKMVVGRLLSSHHAATEATLQAVRAQLSLQHEATLQAVRAQARLLAAHLGDPLPAEHLTLWHSFAGDPPHCEAPAESCLALADEAMWTRSLSRPAVATPLQPSSLVHAAEPVGPAVGEGVQQTLVLFTKQVSHIASRVDSPPQAAQTAPAAEEGLALQTQMHLKEVVQQELRSLLEQVLTPQMPSARTILPAPAVLEAVQQALTPHLNGMAAQQQQQLADAAASYENTTRHMLEDFAEQQAAQQQQLVRRPVQQRLVRQPLHRSPTSRASDAAYSGQLGLNRTSPAGPFGDLLVAMSATTHGLQPSKSNERGTDTHASASGLAGDPFVGIRQATEGTDTFTEGAVLGGGEAQTDLLAGSSFDTATSLVGLECSIAKRVTGNMPYLLHFSCKSPTAVAELALYCQTEWTDLAWKCKLSHHRELACALGEGAWLRANTWRQKGTAPTSATWQLSCALHPWALAETRPIDQLALMFAKSPEEVTSVLTVLLSVSAVLAVHLHYTIWLRLRR